MKLLSFQVRVIIFSFCVLLLCSSSAYSAVTLTAAQAQTLNNAYKEFQNGNFEKSIKMSEPFILAGQAHTFAYTIYGLANAQVGNYKKAITAYETGLKLYPDDYTLRHNYANALMKVNRNKDAGRIFESIIGGAPAEQKSSIRYLSAQNYYLGEDFKSAARLAEPLVQAKNVKKDILELVALSHMGAKNHAKAEKYLSLYVNLFPFEVDAWNAYAGYYINRNNLKKAGTLLAVGNKLNKNSNQVGRINRYLPSLYANISAVRLEFQSLKLIIANTKESAKSYSNLKEQELISVINSGNYKKALNYIDKELSTKPSSFLYYMKGNVYTRLLDNVSAQNSYAIGAEYKDNYGNVCLYTLAMSYWENREWEKAQVEFRKLLNVKEYAQYAEHSLTNLEQIQEEELLLTTLSDEQ